MRFILVAAALVLASCGPSKPAAEEKPAAAPEALRPTSPALKVYESKKFIPLNGGEVKVSADGVDIVTDTRQGAMSASLNLGPEAKAEGVKLRVNFSVSDGRLTMLMTHANFEAGFKPYQQSFVPGTSTVDLPIDRSGEMPLLVLSNGRNDGKATIARVTSVELVQ